MGIIPLKVGREDYAASRLCWGDLCVPGCGCQSPGLSRRGAEGSAGLGRAQSILLCWERVGKEDWGRTGSRMERASKGEGGCGKVPAKERRG